jgi:hypothetical protein
MNNLKRILENQLELNNSLRSYDEVSYVRPEIKKDDKGKYQEKVSYSQYKGETEYPDNGVIGYREEKIYLECKHEKTRLFSTFHKCEDCGNLVLPKEWI